MKNKITFALYTVLIGTLIGLTVFIFGFVLNQIISILPKLYPYNVLLLPLVGLLIIYLKNNQENKLHQSMQKVFLSTKKNHHLSLLIIPYQMLSTWLSHLVGASVGREGVAIQLGAVLSNNFQAKINNLNLTKAHMTSIGMGSGFAALFSTPIAGIVIALELTSVKINYYYLFMLIGCSFIANFITSSLNLPHFHNLIIIDYSNLNLSLIIRYLIAIIIIVTVGMLFAIVLKKSKKYLSKLIPNQYLKIFVFGVILVILILITDGRYMSLGLNLIDQSFNNFQAISTSDFLFKFILTILAISIGFQGGEVTPLFAIGSTLGVMLASVLFLDPLILAAIGYGFVFANATKAQYTGFILTVGLFGITLIPIALVALMVSKLINQRHSIYDL